MRQLLTTRLMGLERERQRRDRLLRAMLQRDSAGLKLGASPRAPVVSAVALSSRIHTWPPLG